MRRLWTAGALVLVSTASTMLAACASTTNGTGNGSATPTPTVVAPSSSTAVSSPAPTTESLTPSLTIPTESALPEPVDPPAVCATGGCTKNASADLGEGYTVTLYTGSGADGSVGSTVLELSESGTSVFWQVTDEQVAGDLACAAQPKPNCVVVAGVGAHASIASGYTRVLNRLVKYGEVPSDTPLTDPVDLNGDGLVDVVTAINTYEPSYATGTVYWQTFQSTGTSFQSTGCTKPQHTLPPDPTTPLTGTCP